MLLKDKNGCQQPHKKALVVLDRAGSSTAPAAEFCAEMMEGMTRKELTPLNSHLLHCISLFISQSVNHWFDDEFS